MIRVHWSANLESTHIILYHQIHTNTAITKNSYTSYKGFNIVFLNLNLQ